MISGNFSHKRIKSKLFLFLVWGAVILLASSLYVGFSDLIRSFQTFTKEFISITTFTCQFCHSGLSRILLFSERFPTSGNDRRGFTYGLISNWQYLPFLLILAFLNYLLRFVRWDYYLSHIEINLSKKKSFIVFMSGLIMSITPGKIGELLKSYMVKELNGTPISYSAPVVLVERFTDFIAIVILSTYGVFFLKYGISALIINTMLIFCLLFVISYRSVSLEIFKLFHKLPIVSKITYKLEIAYESTHRLMTPKPLILATFVSIAAWFCECYAFYLVFKGFNLSTSLFYSIFVYAFSTLVGALSMLPGGLGATEASMTGLMILIQGIPKDIAVTATFIIRVCTLWFAVLVGTLALVLSGNIFIRNGNSGTLKPEKNSSDHA